MTRIAWFAPASLMLALGTLTPSRGEAALVPISIDARALTAGSAFFVNEVTGYMPVSLVQTITVDAPGSYRFTHGSGNSFVFGVDASGNLTLDAAAAAVATGAGTDTLTILGARFDIDATALTPGSFYINETANYRPTSAVQSTTVLPGRYRFSHGNGTSFVFEVGPAGEITLDPALAFGSASGPLLTVRGFPIQIDARALTPSAFYVNETTGYRQTSAVQSLTVIPGALRLTHGNGNSFVFRVDAAGNVAVEAPASLFASASGAVLTVAGVSFSIDARALTRSAFYVNETLGYVPTGAVQTIVGLPGAYRFSHGNGNSFVFRVGSAGEVSVDAGPALFTSATGSVLTVNGYTFTIDARRLTAPSFYISETLDYVPTAQVQTITGIPGGYRFNQSNGATFVFTLEGSGDIALSEANQRFASGSAGALVIDGLGFQIDASGLPQTSGGFLISDVTGDLQAGSITAVRGVPGAYRLYHYDFGSFTFTLDAQGLLQGLPAALGTQAVTGNATSLLTLGTPPPPDLDITIDARALTTPSFDIHNSAFSSGALPRGSTHRLALPEGSYSFRDARGNIFNFSVVGSTRLLAYDASFDGFLSGRGTRTLVVRGYSVTIDARELSAVLWEVPQIAGTFDKGTVPALTLIPGPHYAFSNNGIGQVSIPLDVAGLWAYDEALEGCLTGRGTRALTVHGHAMTISASALTAPNHHISYVGSVLKSAPNTFRLIPSTYYFSTDGVAGSLLLTTTPDGKWSYAPEVSGIVTGAGTSEVTVHGTVVKIDARALTTPTFYVSNVTGHMDRAEVGSMTVIPAWYYFHDARGNYVNGINVTSNGVWAFDPSMSALLGGAGTDTLVVKGFRFDIDARGLAAMGVSSFYLASLTGNLSTAAVQAITGIPGGQYALNANSTNLFFSIDGGGLFAGLPASFLGQPVSGNGTSHLSLGVPPPPDSDGDGVGDGQDNCPALANAGQEDQDHDGAGDVCDDDDDGDGVADTSDNCPLTANPDQADSDLDHTGNACDSHFDSDTVADLIESSASAAIRTITSLPKLPGGNGLVAKVGGIIAAVNTATDQREAGTLSLTDYVAALDGALASLADFDRQVDAKATSPKRDPQLPAAQADQLRAASAEIRSQIQLLKANAQ